MSFIPLSSEQLELLRVLNTSPATLVTYFDKDYKYSTLAAFFFDTLIKEKSICLITKDEEQKNTFERLFKNLGLSQILFVHSPSGQISSDQLSYLRSALKRDVSKDYKSEYVRSKLVYETSLNLCTNQIEGLNKAVLGSRKWRQVAYQYQSVEVVDHFNVLHDLEDRWFDFDQSELYSIRGRIQKAQNIFDPEYIHLKLLSPFSDEILKEKNSIELAQRVQKQLLLLDKTHTELNQLIAVKKHSRKEQLDQAYIRITSLLRSIEIENKLEEQFSVQKEQKSNWFKKEVRSKEANGQELLKELGHLVATLVNLKVIPQGNSIENLTEAQSFLQNLRKEWNSTINAALSQFVKRMNVVNFDDQAMVELDEKLNRQIASLNRYKIFPSELENRANNLNGKLEFVRNLIVELKRGLYLLSNYPDFIEWDKFMISVDDKTRHIINKLTQAPRIFWLSIFDKWYLRKILNLTAPLHLPDSNNAYNGHIEALHVYRQKSGNYWEDKFTDTLKAQSSKLKNFNKSAYLELFKKESGDQLVVRPEHGQFISSVYPIQLMSMEAFGATKKEFFGHCDIIALDDVFNAEEVKKAHELGKKMVAFLPQSVGNVLEGVASFNDFTLNLTQIPNSVEIEQDGAEARLLSCKKIARLLYYLFPNFRTYQSKHHSIISLADQIYNKHLESTLENDSIRGIDTKNFEMQRLVEAFLATDKEIIVLLEDGLVNPNCSKSFEWQTLLIQKLRQLKGVVVLDLWTYDLVHRNGRANFELISKLKKNWQAEILPPFTQIIPEKEAEETVVSNE